MKHLKAIFLFVAFLSVVSTASAQSWQGIVKHNGYSCHSMGSLVNHTVLAAKTTDVVGREMLHIKFKIPYNWGNTSSACVNVRQTNIPSGKEHTGGTHLGYKNGWVYITQYLLCENTPCETYIVTVYKDNDWGTSKGEQRVYNLKLESLKPGNLALNGEMELYW